MIPRRCISWLDLHDKVAAAQTFCQDNYHAADEMFVHLFHRQKAGGYARRKCNETQARRSNKNLKAVFREKRPKRK